MRSYVTFQLVLAVHNEAVLPEDIPDLGHDLVYAIDSHFDPDDVSVEVLASVSSLIQRDDSAPDEPSMGEILQREIMSSARVACMLGNCGKIHREEGELCQ